MSLLSRLLLPIAATTSVFTLTGLSWLPAALASSSAYLNSGRRAQLFLTSLAALSSALTLHLAVGALSDTKAGDSSRAYVSSDPDDSDNDSEDKKDDDKDKDSVAAEDGKRWLKKEEVWSETDDDWVPRKVKEESADEAEAKRRTLFVVKHRTNPKQPGSKGHIVIEFTNSGHIVDILRKTVKDSEELFEDDARIDDDKKLFLAKEAIQEQLAMLKAEKERRKDEEKQESYEGTKEKEDEDASDTEEKKNSDNGEKKSTENEEIKVSEIEEKKVPNAEEPTASSDKSDKPADPNKDDEDSDEDLSYPDLITRIDHTEVLLVFIDEHFASIQAKLDRLLPKGMISFKLLWCVVKPGTIVKITHKPSGEAHAMMVKQSYYYSTISGEQYFISGHYLDWAGDKYVRLDTSDSITAFAGLSKMSTLSVTPITETDRSRLIERGQKLAQYCGKPAYEQFEGALITPGPRPGTFMKQRADGRVMIDKAGFRKMVPALDIWDTQPDDYDDYYTNYEREQNKTTTSQGGTIKDDHVPSELSELSTDLHYLLLPPTLFGFSFALKEWGEMVLNFEKIIFDSLAWDHLEVDPDHKFLLRALVDASRDDRSGELMTDVVKGGKGGGIICLLHGPPGVGKTLTAEAVAELLERPLFIQGAGDLGTDAASLERRLRDSLEIAQSWKSVVLIDEADVYMEQRSQSEVHRNSLVSCFLRQLEYTNGIIFLTTNRVKTFDEAFLSRFSVAVRYPDLDSKRRRLVWQKFLKLAGCDVEGQTPEHSVPPEGSTGNGTKTPAKGFISTKEITRFAQEQLNGRVIKQTVRTAQALAISNNEPLNVGHIDQILRINKRFVEDFESAAPDYQVQGEGWRDRTGLYH